jgi:hypothetical protein
MATWLGWNSNRLHKDISALVLHLWEVLFCPSCKDRQIYELVTGWSILRFHLK